MAFGRMPQHHLAGANEGRTLTGGRGLKPQSGPFRIDTGELTFRTEPREGLSGIADQRLGESPTPGETREHDDLRFATELTKSPSLTDNTSEPI